MSKESYRLFPMITTHSNLLDIRIWVVIINIGRQAINGGLPSTSLKGGDAMTFTITIRNISIKIIVKRKNRPAANW